MIEMFIDYYLFNIRLYDIFGACWKMSEDSPPWHKTIHRGKNILYCIIHQYSYNNLFINIFTNLFIYEFIHLSNYQSINPFIYQSVYLPIIY